MLAEDDGQQGRPVRFPLLLPSLVCLLSGSAAILFETLWFRVLGYTLGSSSWATNIVLASFMAGLAAGNAIAARYGMNLRRPLLAYATIEGIVGVSGLAIVVLLPPLSPVLGRMFAHALTGTWLVNLLRVTVAFSLMLVPATAMGLTLPLLTKAVTRHDANFGRALGWLYGWNTVGGVLGALYGELFLIARLGQRGTALAACALNLLAATLTLVLVRQWGARVAHQAPIAPPPEVRSWRPLAAAFLAGGTLLGLEVVWFRFLQLFVFGTSFAFALMLAVVLLGIGVGGLIAAGWLGRDPRAHRFTPLLALAAGVSVAASYAFFRPHVGGAVYVTGSFAVATGLFIRLILPTSLLSGVLFTMLGAAQRRESREEAEAVGRLTLANTLGAMLGALLAGFVLLPRIGMEGSLLVLMLSYGLVAGLTIKGLPWSQKSRIPRVALVALTAAFVLTGVLYPFGLLRQRFLPLVLERYQSAKPDLVALREGPTETVMVLRVPYRDRALYYRLMTNGHSMSATSYRGRRYMKLYVYWAMAVNPDARRALLIGYGVGNTAKALTDTRRLESIDVVDISPEVLEQGSIAFSGTAPPLSDPRVRVHVEDGRFFLQTTDQSYDIITSEPPPLRAAGVTSLYSREYFQLLRSRLREGGVVTYWLPVNLLWASETKAIMRAFCDAFADCSLWNGAGLQWMLAGTRGARGPLPEEPFTAQWRDEVVAPELTALGFENPEMLGTTFLADATTLDEWTRGVAPLDDDHPGRIKVSYPTYVHGDPIYRDWMNPRAVRERFQSSAYLRELWPPALRERSKAFFAPQGALEGMFVWGLQNSMQVLHGALTRSSLRTFPLLLTGTDPDTQRIAVPLYQAGSRDSALEFEMGAKAMSERQYLEAEQHLALVTEKPELTAARLVRSLALGLLGRVDEARACLGSLRPEDLGPADINSVQWLDQFLQRHRAEEPQSQFGQSLRPNI